MIRTTHVGGLPRSTDVLTTLTEREAGTDCGMATSAAGGSALDAKVAWAKLRSLVEGADLAGQRRS